MLWGCFCSTWSWLLSLGFSYMKIFFETKAKKLSPKWFFFLLFSKRPSRADQHKATGPFDLCESFKYSSCNLGLHVEAVGGCCEVSNWPCSSWGSHQYARDGLLMSVFFRALRHCRFFFRPLLLRVHWIIVCDSELSWKFYRLHVHKKRKRIIGKWQKSF